MTTYHDGIPTSCVWVEPLILELLHMLYGLVTKNIGM
jgi:hypothetical protein